MKQSMINKTLNTFRSHLKNGVNDFKPPQDPPMGFLFGNLLTPVETNPHKQSIHVTNNRFELICTVEPLSLRPPVGPGGIREAKPIETSSNNKWRD
jgi:hypothetical protein